MTETTTSKASQCRQSHGHRVLFAFLAVMFAIDVRAAIPNLNGIWRITNGATFVPRGDKTIPPMKGDYARIYAERLAAAERGAPIDDQTASCFPQGMPRLMNLAYPMEITQIPERIVIYAEWNMQTRRIYLDGRKFPPADELDLSYNGYSIGHWEGEELVVETRGLREDTLFDSTGLPHSDALIIRERFRLVDPATLHNVITVEDAKAFTHPWSASKIYKRAPELTILEYVCLENNRNPMDENGVTQTILPGDSATKP